MFGVPNIDGGRQNDPAEQVCARSNQANFSLAHA